MTEKIHFLPWVRAGLGRGIAARDDGTSSLAAHPVVDVSFRVAGREVGRELALQGPGDVISLRSSAISRFEPPPHTDDFEPNYFPFVEFREPDLPWRYTPASPGPRGVLRPWVVLVVVEVRDGVSVERHATREVEVLEIAHPADPSVELPDLSESWTWAHVESDVPAEEIATARRLVSRVLCPRRLEPDREYVACLVPAMDVGVAAGLGLPWSGAEAGPAWNTPAPSSITLPVYASWTFRTSDAGDFESLCRRLGPDASATEVGRVPMDITHALPEMGWRGDEVRVDYVGPLKSDVDPGTRWDSNHRAVFRQTIDDLLEPGRRLRPRVAESLPPGYDPASDDPVLSIPAYGAMHADLADDWGGHDWARQLNRHPRHRAAAGLGAEIVRTRQDEFLDAAWKQLEAGREADRLLRQSRFAVELQRSIARRVARLPEGTGLAVTSDLHAFVDHDNGPTVAAALVGSEVPEGLVSRAAARTIRSTAVRRGTSKSLDAVATPFLKATATEAPVAIKGVLEYAAFQLPDKTLVTDSTLLREPGDAARIVDLEIHTIDPGPRRHARRIRARRRVDIARVMGTEIRGDAFRELSPSKALRQLQRLGSGLQPLKSPPSSQDGVDVSRVFEDLRGALDPLPRIRDAIVDRSESLGAHLGPGELPSRFDVAPRFDDALYRDLVSLGSHWMVPGLDDVPEDSVKVLVPDPAFVAAFLVGANQEMSRELLWREFPTELDNTFFHRFWDRIDGVDDIAPLHQWTGPLDAQPTFDAAGLTVFLVRGELVRRYPEARFYLTRRVGDEPDLDEVELPVLQGQLDARTIFVGFSMALEDVVANTYVTIEEEPGKSRFGFDATPSVTFAGWDDMSWPRLGEGTHARLSGSGPDGTASFDDAEWGFNSAHVARIAYQHPFRYLVPADRLSS